MQTRMPQPSRLKLMPLNLGAETFGQRLARIRRQRALTQTDLAQTIGLTQSLLSAYESDRLRLRADLVARFAIALKVTADDLLGLKPVKEATSLRTVRLVNRLRRIEELPPAAQRVVLATLDAMLAKHAGRKQRARSRQAVGG